MKFLLDIHEYKAMLVASAEEKQELGQAIESVERMGFARDEQILALENESRMMETNCKYIMPEVQIIIADRMICMDDLELIREAR